MQKIRRDEERCVFRDMQEEGHEEMHSGYHKDAELKTQEDERRMKAAEEHRRAQAEVSMSAGGVRIGPMMKQYQRRRYRRARQRNRILPLCQEKRISGENMSMERKGMDGLNE